MANPYAGVESLAPGWWIGTADGGLVPLRDPDSDVGVWAETVAEVTGAGVTKPVSPPKHLGLIVPSLSAGPGFRTWTPDGATVLRLVELWMRDRAVELGGQEVITPTLHQWDRDSPLVDLAQKFEPRLFSVGEHGEWVMRYGGDPGFFDYVSSLNLGSDQVPFRVWEFGSFFRQALSGELRGIERLHEFRLLDHHTVCWADDLIEEASRVLHLQVETMSRLVGQVVVHLTVTASVLPEVRSLIAGVASWSSSPVLVEVLARQSSYWSLRTFVHTSGGYRTSNLQVDFENRARFDLLPNIHRGLGILHATTASVERMVLVLTTAASRLAPPELPVWLAPVQVTVVPIDATSDQGQRAFEAIGQAGFRVELDDRDRPLGWRIRDNARRWTPYLAVVGPHEEVKGTMSVRDRSGRSSEMSPGSLIVELSRETEGFPRVGLRRRVRSGRLM